MGIKSTYQSSGSLDFQSNSTQVAYFSLSSQVILQHQTGSLTCVPVITAATSGTNPVFGHLTITGSSSNSPAMNYYLDAPTSPYGQRLTVKCLNASSSSRHAVWASTDGSVTWDGSNQVAIFSSSGGSEVSNWFQAVAVSSQRWHMIGHSTTNLLFSTQST